MRVLLRLEITAGRGPSSSAWPLQGDCEGILVIIAQGGNASAALRKLSVFSPPCRACQGSVTGWGLIPTWIEVLPCARTGLLRGPLGVVGRRGGVRASWRATR